MTVHRSISTLPVEIWQNVFRYCSYNDVLLCSTLDPHWKDAVSSDYFWKHIAKYTIYNPVILNNRACIMIIDMLLNIPHGNYSVVDTDKTLSIESGKYCYGEMIGTWSSLIVEDFHSIAVIKQYNKNQEHGETLVEYRTHSGVGFKTRTWYANGSQHGTYTKYVIVTDPNETEILDTIGEYKDNRRTGEWEWYNTAFIDAEQRNPELMIKGSYSNGVRHGHWYFYPGNNFYPLRMIDGMFDNNSMSGLWTATYHDDEIPSGRRRICMTARSAADMIRDTISNSFLEE